MDDSESGLDISTVNTVETPVGTPSPPNAASTVARPPPRPRRLPHINFLEDAVEGMIKNLSLDNGTVSFSRNHEDTPHPSPALATNEVPSPENLQSPVSQDDSTETVVPAFGIDPVYLAPTPGPRQLPEHPNMGLSCFFDSTILEDIEPPSGIFLLEMTRKDEVKEQEFASLAAIQEFEFEENPALDLDQEEASFQGDSGSYQYKVEDDFYAGLEDKFESEFDNKTNDEVNEDVEFGQGTIEEESKEDLIEIENESKSNSEQENSMSDYFKLKTSNLGKSPGDLDFSAKLNLSRPNFGLDELNSPKPKPVSMITPAEILKETIELSESKNHNLTQNDLKELHNIAQMVIKSSPGHDVSFYAQQVLTMLLEKQQKQLQEETIHVTQFLPSFLEETKINNFSRIENRHSSPKKVKLPSPKERQPLGNITNFVQKLEYSEQLQSEKQVNFEDQKEVFDISDDSRLTHLSVISSQTEPKKSPERRTMRFPIEANRRNLTWIVFNSEPQEHFVTLLNKLNKPMKLTCLIQNDNQDEFSFSKNLNFGEDDHDHHPGCGKVLDITIGAQCKRDIFVKYQPSNLGESEANLVLKPHGIARDKKTLKSKVQLKAYHFESYKVAIVCNEQPLTKPVLFVEETSLKILVKNEGHCSIFCKIIHAKSKHNFVLNRGQEKRLKIGLTTDLLSQPEDLTIFYGPEIARQIFKSTGEGAESSFLRGEDFKGYFDGEQPYKNESNDISHFFRTIHYQNVQVHLNPQFHPLNPEITYEKEKKTLRLAEETIYFDDVQNVCKVKVKNPTLVPCTFAIHPLDPNLPFEKYHDTVVVKPKHYLSIPIKFRPLEPGKYRSLFTLTHVESGKLFTAKLIGESN